MVKQPLLRRYTELAPLLYLLQKQALTLLSPWLWDDRNDAHFLESHRLRHRFECVLALCFTEASETYHHWRVFAGSSSGVCLEFDKRLLSTSVKPVPGVRLGSVNYMTIGSLERASQKDLDLPFIKRYPFRDEQEFRIIFEDSATSREAKDLPFDPSALQRVIVNPWMSKAVYDSVKTLILGIDGWKHLKVSRTTLVDNERWRQCAAGVNPPANEALQPTSRAPGKAKSPKRSRAARG